MNSNNNNNSSGSEESMIVRDMDWNLKPSELSQRVLNPIRKIVDGMTISPNPSKELIKLTIGDPTVFGNLNVAEECVDAVVRAVRSGKHNGYPSSLGSMEARQAVADYSTSMGAPASVQDVVLTSGCSQALELVITLLANPGQNILVPRPGFPLYQTLAHSMGIETKFYDLQPENDWKVDVGHMISQIDGETAAIIINSPSNPCGGVFSREHVQEIIDVCDMYRIPIIADEVYEHVVYNDKEHYPFASVSETVPVFTVSSISKRFLVPGWRLGWVIVHDRAGAITDDMRRCLTSLTQRTLGPCSIVQGALPDILKSTPQSSFDFTTQLVQNNSRMFYKLISGTKGLKPIEPAGALYMMVKIDLDNFPTFKSDIEFTESLMSEESVFCLPASCFSMPGFFRIVLCVPKDKAIEACERIALFCQRHYQCDDHLTTSFKKTGKVAILSRITSSVYLLNNVQTGEGNSRIANNQRLP